MRYSGERDYDHSRAENIGVVLANLGTPPAATTSAVRKYLREFLSDPRVVEAPRLLWHLILNGWILPRRSPKTAAAYRSIWQAEGSPLMVISRRQAAKLQESFCGLPVVVERDALWQSIRGSGTCQFARAQLPQNSYPAVISAICRQHGRRFLTPQPPSCTSGGR